MRRRSGGAGGGGGQLSQELRRYVYGFKQLGSATEDDVVEHLRSKHPRFLRLKVETLRSLVRKTLADSPSHRPNKRPQSPPLTFDGGDDDGEEEEGPSGEAASRKKRRRGDEGEERLRRMEIARLRRVRRGGESEESEESESSDDNGDGAVSTSEDAVYGEKLEPKFDLMKSMLRDSYKEKERPKEKEKNVELEVPGPEKAAMKRPLVPVPGGEAKRAGGRSSSSIGGGGEEGSKGGDGEGPRFRDLGGMKEVLEELEMEVLVPLCHPQLPRWLGVRPLSGILLHGPPGCGKTKLAHAIANETGVPFYKISATEVVSGVSGASEENIRELFLKAQRTAPSIIFIDEIDAIASKRENLQREMERRIVTQLMTCMDESHRLVKPSDGNSGLNAPENTPGYVLVIGATNRPDALDPALRRPGRFDREIALRVPDENARVEILSVLAKELRLEGSFDLLKIARSTPGFVGADLKAVANKAGNLSMKRIANERKSEISKSGENEERNELWWKEPWLPEEMEKLSITMADFEEAVKMVQPSSKREGFSDIPNKKWEDVGGLDHLRQEFERYIVRRIKYPEDYEGFGVDMETGFLLYGPPGCGKTLIAKAVANEAGANFIHVKGPELLNKYVGDSELAVRILFSRARTCSPCIIFFDEVDALTTKRGKEGGWVVERLLNQLLVELDGAEQRHGVYVIGATNRPEMMDKAILRPGRFGKLLYVPLPSPHQRSLILQAVAREKPIDASVDLNAIAQMEACENFSGADLAALVNEAGMTALEEKQRSTNSAVMSYAIKTAHFELAMKKIAPSVTILENQYYEALSKTFKSV